MAPTSSSITTGIVSQSSPTSVGDNSENNVLNVSKARVPSASQAFVPGEKPSPMPSSTHIFTGKKGESLGEWLFLINNGFVLSNIPDEKRLVMAVQFLRFGPLHTIKHFITEKKSWESFSSSDFLAIEAQKT